MDSNQALELERGEDIDLITGVIDGRVQSTDRVLEQVKHRRARITLRTAEARAAVANFFEHRTTNAGRLSLQFRFTTNAEIGRERKPALRGGMAGIQGWELERLGALPAQEAAAIRRGLRELLRGGDCPPGVRVETWAAFQVWLESSSEGDFEAFLSAFEWATHHEGVVELRAKVLAELRARRLADTDIEAEMLYQRLFLAVFTRLASAGIKQLSPEDLAAEVAATSPVDTALMARMQLLYDALEGRVGRLEQEVHDVQHTLQVITGQAIRELAQRSDVVATFDTQAVPPVLLPPPPVPHSSRREAVIADLLRGKAGPQVVVLTGASGAGKTQLALLTASAIGQRQWWVRLRDLTTEEAAQHLDSSIAWMCRGAAAIDWQTGDWATHCAAAASTADVIVIDDVPQCRDGDPVASRIVALVQGSLEEGTWVILTAAVHPAPVGSAVGDHRLTNLAVPPLTAEEIKDIAASYGAPQGFVNSRAPEMILGITRGHPVLVQAIAKFLNERGWRLTDQVLSEVFRNRFAQPLTQATLTDVLATVTDREARQLLHRLSLLDDDFEMDDAAALADVNPVIDEPETRLASLVGPWIEAGRDGRFAVSPLIRVLGAGDVPEAVKKECHRAMARRIVSRRRLGEREVSAALRHFIGAEDYDRAGLILIQALHSLLQAPVPVVQNSLLPRVWRGMPIPDAMDGSLAMQIRAHQAVLAHRMGDDPAPMLEELESQCGEQEAVAEWAVFGVSIIVATYLALESAPLAAPFVARTVRLWPRMKKRLPEVASLVDEDMFGGVESLLWVLSGGVDSPLALDRWLAAVAEVSVDARQRLFARSMGAEGAAVLANRPLLWEYAKPLTDRHWHEAIRQLKQVEQQAAQWGATSLEAAAVGARIAAMLEGGEAGPKVDSVATAAMERFASDPDAAFLVAKSAGFGFLDRGLHDGAKKWLCEAAGLGGSDHGLDRVHLELRLAQLELTSAPQRAIELAKSAVARARTVPAGLVTPRFANSASEPPSRRLIAQACGELAIVLWETGDRLGTGRALVEMIAALVDDSSRADSQWKALFVTAGHIVGYFTTLITTGQPPSVLPDGQPYVAPRAGLLLAPKEEAALLFDEKRVALLGVHAMHLAAASGDEDVADYWAERSARALKEAGLWNAAVVPLQRLLERNVMCDNHSEAIDRGFEIASTLVIARSRGAESVDVLKADDEPRMQLETRRAAAGTPSEVDAVVFTEALLPTYVRACATMLSGLEGERSVMEALRDACLREARTTLDGPEEGDCQDDPWRTAAWACESLLAERINAEGLIDLAAKAAAKKNEWTCQTIAVMAYLGASLDPSLPLHQRARSQIAVANYIHGYVRRSPRLYAEVVLPFFLEYWRLVFQRERFRFTAPALVEQDLESVSAVGVDLRLQHLLRTIASGLQLTLSPTARAWMSGVDSEANGSR